MQIGCGLATAFEICIVGTRDAPSTGLDSAHAVRRIFRVSQFGAMRCEVHIVVVESSQPFWNVRVMATRCVDLDGNRSTPRHVVVSHSVMVPPTPSVLAREVDFRMHNPHVPCECITARKSLLLDA